MSKPDVSDIYFTAVSLHRLLDAVRRLEGARSFYGSGQKVLSEIRASRQPIELVLLDLGGRLLDI